MADGEIKGKYTAAKAKAFSAEQRQAFSLRTLDLAEITVPEKEPLPKTASTALDVSDVRYSYGRKAGDTLSGVSFSVREHEIVGLVGANGCGKTTIGKLAALRNLHLLERLIMIVAVIFRFFPVLSGDMKLLRQSIRTRGVFTSPLQKLRALSSYIEILTVPMALRVIRIAETLSASAETRGIDLTRRKSNYLSLRFSAWDAVFCVLLAASIAAGLIL